MQAFTLIRLFIYLLKERKKKNVLLFFPLQIIFAKLDIDAQAFPYI